MTELGSCPQLGKLELVALAPLVALNPVGLADIVF
jgi:hypothetical protein